MDCTKDTMLSSNEGGASGKYLSNISFYEGGAFVKYLSDIGATK